MAFVFSLKAIDASSEVFSLSAAVQKASSQQARVFLVGFGLSL